MNSSTDWVPSHVQVTTSSELYVTVCTDKEKFVTSSVPRSIEPEWNFNSEIPLMSLDTTLHIAVRQKGRLSDEFIGYIPLPLGGFKLSSKLVTHWYKLGPRPGKQNLKLRGDLEVSVQLQFKWVQLSDTIATETTSSRKVYPVKGKSLLKRSKSDVKTQERSSSLPNEALLSEQANNAQSSKVKEKMSVFRRSFRKKNRSPVVQNCEDEFTIFSSPTNQRVRSDTIDVSSSTPEISQGLSGADISSSESENGLLLKPSVRALFAEAAALEEEGTEETIGEGGAGDSVKTSPAARYNSFRSRKKRWTTNTLPLHTPSPAHTPTDHTPTLDEVTYIAKSNSTAHSPSLSRNRTLSLCMDESSSGLYGSAGEVNASGYSPEISRKVDKQDPESGYNTSSSVHKIKHLAVSDGIDDAAEAPKKEEKTAKRSPPGNKRPISRTNSPYTNRRTVTSPISRVVQSSGQESVRQKPRTLSTSNSIKREPKLRTPSSSTPFPLKITPIRFPVVTPGGGRPGGTRPLSRGTRSVSMRERAPVKRRPKSMIVENGNKARYVSEKRLRESTIAGSVSEKVENSVNKDAQCDDKTVTVNESSNESSKVEHSVENDIPCVRPSSTPLINNISKEESENIQTDANDKKETLVSEDPCKPESDGGSSAEQLLSSTETDVTVTSKDKKSKHTVAYSEESPLFKAGFQPVSLLPPSLMDYHSQTLPSRSKLARHSSDNNFAISQTQRPSTVVSNSQDMLNKKDVVLRQSSHNPRDNSVAYRRSMNIALLASYNPEILNPIPQSPPGTMDINSLEDLNRSLSRISTTSTISQDSESRPSTPSTPNSTKYGGKTQGEIVTGAFKNRRPTGGLRQAINMYQESRKQKTQNLRTPQTSLKVEEECLDRSTSSNEGSPRVKRNRSAASAFSNIVRNPFSSLKRTQSLNPSPRTSIVSSFDTTNTGSVTDLQPPSLQVPSNSLISIIATESNSRKSSSVEKPLTNSLEGNKPKILPEMSNLFEGSARDLREDTPTLTDTSSIKTLTGAECNPLLSIRRTSSPNPAGAAVSSHHVRHTTASSIGSEGIGSLTSEELSLDDLLNHDCAQWSKEELVKELIHSNQRLKNTENELKDVKNYLDNLLLRIMETNPTLLSTVSSS